jgi:hypothetical protein
MRQKPANFQNRRHLFIGAARYAALGLLCAGAALLAAKRYWLKRRGICINDGLCSRCKVLNTCRLPLALAAKRIPEE